ncbi:MAG: LuxR family transcriptional regulator, partial [Anaerolineae bacterium]
MTTPLLKTKLYIPPIRPELVSRPRLIERLNAGLGRKLTLVSASAGFGKTTLLSEWVGACGRPVAWVSLDEGDNDPIRFWAYFIAALGTIPAFKEADVGRSALAMLQTPGFPAAETSLPIEALLTGLINEIVEIAVSFAFVLDDFHLIAERQIHETMAFLIDHLPPQMHLILSSRADPPWPLARLRARREMAEFRINDLRFTPEEAATFLNDAMGLALSPEDVAALEARTEGWIAGLQMAAISVRGWRRRRAHRNLTRFIESFTGSHRFVLDYLVEEVLEQQPPAVQEFLLRTSILGQVTASLCDALTGRKDSQAVLTQLDQANLFLVPLDDERRWYRYHRLFADLLRSRLAQGQPGQVSVLHRRASEWYKGNGLIAEAVNHAFAAGDLEWAVGLIEENALSMIYRHELATLVGWLNALPADVVRARPWLCVAHAWALVNIGQLEAVEPLLQGAEKALVGLDEQAEGPVLSAAEGPVLSAAEGRRIASYIAFVRAYLAGLNGDMALAAKLTREALERLPEEDLMARSYAVMWLAFTLRWNGDLVAATQAFSQAITVSQAAGDIHINLHSLSGLAGLQRMLGQLRKAVVIYQDALRLADEYAREGGWKLPITSLLHSNMSAVLREWNDLEAALLHATEGFELSKHWGQPDILLRGYVEMAAIRQAMRDAGAALEAIQKARQVASGLTSWADAALAVDEARLRLA